MLTSLYVYLCVHPHATSVGEARREKLRGGRGKGKGNPRMDV